MLSLVQEQINSSIINSQNRWLGSPFEPIVRLSNDERGKFGEELVNSIALKTNLPVVFEGDANTNNQDGVFDILINNQRCEVKLATLDVNNSFQHENLYADSVWDYVIFVDVVQQGIYFTILRYDEFNVNEKHPIFGRKPSLRRSQSDKFKFDLSLKSMDRGLACGLTVKYNVEEDNMDEVITFIKNHLN
jgi:hypothetical protein